MTATMIRELGAVELLQKEHEVIKGLFRQFEDATSDRQKKTIGDTCLRAIETYIAMKEDIFYPAVRRHLGERRLIVHALAAHQVAKLLINELKDMASGERYVARFAVLKENVLQLIDEEENEMLPRVEKFELDHHDVAVEMLRHKSRVAPFGYSFGSRKIATTLAVAAAVGAVVWYAKRSSSSRGA